LNRPPHPAFEVVKSLRNAYETAKGYSEVGIERCSTTIRRQPTLPGKPKFGVSNLGRFLDHLDIRVLEELFHLICLNAEDVVSLPMLFISDR